MRLPSLSSLPVINRVRAHVGRARDPVRHVEETRDRGDVPDVAIGKTNAPQCLAVFLLAETLDAEILLLAGTFVSIGLTFLLGLVATALAAYVKLRGAWAVVGLVTGIISTMAGPPVLNSNAGLPSILLPSSDTRSAFRRKVQRTPAGRSRAR